MKYYFQPSLKLILIFAVTELLHGHTKNYGDKGCLQINVTMLGVEGLRGSKTMM